MRANFLLVALAACHRPVAPAPPSLPAYDLAATGSAAHLGAGSDSFFAELDSDDHPAFQHAVAYTSDVVSTPEFRAVLARFDQLEVSAGGSWLTGGAVARIYAGHTTLKALEVCYEYREGGGRVTADTRIDTHCDRVNDDYAVTRVSQIVLDRLDQVPEGRACAINTFAHEWTHSIVGGDNHAIFTDSGYQRYDDAIVSYTVGAVAQCVYLQRWRSQFDIDACVRAVGTHGFRACTCDPGWLDALIAGDTSCR
jgi:hypothetical protein